MLVTYTGIENMSEAKSCPITVKAYSLTEKVRTLYR